MSVAAACLAALLMVPFVVPNAHAELLTRDGLSQRADYLNRVEALVTALTAVDRSVPQAASSEFRSLAVTLDAALRDLRLSEAGRRAGKVSPPTAFAAPSAAAAAGERKSLDEIPDDWLLQSVQDARNAVDRLAQRLDGGEPLNSALIDQSIAEIVERVSKISRPE